MFYRDAVKSRSWFKKQELLQPRQKYKYIHNHKPNQEVIKDLDYYIVENFAGNSS